MTIGNRIKAARKAKDMTLENLATHARLSRQTISRYETGVIQSIPSDTIEVLAAVLDTTPAYLMGWEVDSKSGHTDLFDTYEIGGFERDMIKTMSEYTDDEKEEVAKLLKLFDDSRKMRNMGGGNS